MMPRFFSKKWTSPAVVEPSAPISMASRLGWVAFFNDCSGEVIARALPLFLTSSLGLTPTFVGVMEGFSEAVGILLRGFSGWLSDRMTSRKPLVFFGYALSVLARVCLLAVQLPLLLGLARVFERTGKGMRVAPRDAMVADGAAVGLSGTAFGITRFLDTLGAITGIVAVLALGVGNGSVTREVFRTCVWASLPFGIMALVLLAFYVPTVKRLTKAKTYLSFHIPPKARGYLLAVFIFSLGNSSDAFLVLKASEIGYSFRAILGLLIVFNALAAVLAIPVGKLTDKIGRSLVLGTGWVVYALVYYIMGTTASSLTFALALMAYGAFYGFTEGTEKALLADLLPPDKRGAGFGAMQLVMGLAALPASLLTGWLMTAYGSPVAFTTAAVLALVGALILLLWRLTARASAPSSTYT